tara:strand:+ start:908 stop:3127 length:2220 start_codon:yes stop_codon:yes gene_type:complete
MGKNRIEVRRRDSEGNRVIDRLSSRPYFFVEEGSPTPFSAKVEGGYTGLYGESLVKVTVKNPHSVTEYKKEHPHVKTWEANITFTNRVMVDNDYLPDNFQHRIWFVDCEWMIDSGKLTIIVVRDSFTDNTYVFFTHPDVPAGKYSSYPCKEHPDGKKNVTFNENIPAIAFDSERDMLKAFATHMKKHDPDVITGWNVIQADCQQIIKRMSACGINPKILSPIKRVRYEFGEWGQPIGGITTIDLMVAFTKLWTLRNGQLPDKSLKTVSSECLGETKVDLPNGHDTYFTDIGTYLDYAVQDVALLPKLNSLNNAIEHYLAVQHIVGCDIRSAPFVTKLFAVMALRDKDFNLRIPTKPQYEHEAYQGADIQEPDAGVYRDVGIFDVKAMYHANVDLHNICWTTLDDNGEDCGNGIRFQQGKQGLLGRQMTRMTELRNKYKALKTEAETEEEEDMYESLQYATKSLVASMYGVAGDSKCGFYHPSVAASITFTARRTLGKLRDECEREGFRVIYGHTDSVFVECQTPLTGKALNEVLNRRMSPIEVEFEKFCDRMIISAKNRYAGLVTWTEGTSHKPKLFVKGIELKQSRLPDLLKTTMKTVLLSILKGENGEKTTDWLVSTVDRIVSGQVSPDEVCIRGKLEKDLSKYKVLGEARAGAAWANENLGKGYRAGSFFNVTLDENGKYIAFDDASEIEGFAQIGYFHIASRFVVEKVRNYFQIAGWDFNPVENALHGKSKIDWF